MSIHIPDEQKNQEPQSVHLTTSSRRLAMARARVIKADGEKGHIEYSVPKVKWWNLFGWMWRYKSLWRYILEDRRWRREKSE